jgi:TonB family protein
MSKRDGRKEVLFVCIGNACRSPMAEAIARLDAPDAIDAFSAGLMPIGFVAELTKQTLMKNGYWAEGLESKGISPGVWERVDVAINMSGRPKEEAFQDNSKVTDWDIEDPFERSPEDYQRVFEKIRARVGELAQEFRREYAASRVAERRSRPRLCATSPMLMSLNGWTAARVVNISEDGLALLSGTALPIRPLQNLRIQFLGPPKALEARCQIAWKSANNKQLGIRLVGLTDEARRFIRDWISTQASYVGFQIQIDRTREEQSLRLDIPNATGTERAVPGANAAAESSRALAVLPAAALGIFESANQILKAAATSGGATSGSEKRTGLVTAENAPRQMNFRTARRAWGEFAAAAVLAAVLTLLFHALVTHREVQNAATANVKQEKTAPIDAAKATTPSPATTTSSISDVAAETAKAPSAIVDAPPPEKAEGVQHDASDADPVRAAERSKHEVSEARSSNAAARPTEKPSRSSLVKTAIHGVDNRLVRPQTPKQAGRFAAGVDSGALQNAKLEASASRPPVPPPLEVKVPEPASLAAMRSADVYPPEPDVKASAVPPAKQQVTLAVMAGFVTVLADPYPSLRVGGRSSKKLRQGASLQLGHLLSRVEPVYPEEAKRQGIQGTVKLHAVVDRYGSVKSLQPVSGPPLLGAAVMNAVRHWQYTETKLAGQLVETEVDLAVVFRLSNPAAPQS